MYIPTIKEPTQNWLHWFLIRIPLSQFKLERQIKKVQPPARDSSVLSSLLFYLFTATTIKWQNSFKNINKSHLSVTFLHPAIPSRHSIRHKDARTIWIILGQNTSQAVTEIVWQMSCASKQKMNGKHLFVKGKIKKRLILLQIKITLSLHRLARKK